MVSVDIKTKPEFKASSPKYIFDFKHAYYLEIRSHALHPEGDRFLMVKPGVEEDGRAQRLIFVENWLDEVERLIAKR